MDLLDYADAYNLGYEAAKTVYSPDNFKTCNLNEHIKVKLTQYGYKIHKDYFTTIIGMLSKSKDHIIPTEYAPNTDDNGYTGYTLWMFMHIFGEYLRPGSESVIEHNQIIFDREPKVIPR